METVIRWLHNDSAAYVPYVFIAWLIVTILANGWAFAAWRRARLAEALYLDEIVLWQAFERRITAALRFYGDAGNYTAPPDAPSRIAREGGQAARQLLADIEQIGGGL